MRSGSAAPARILSRENWDEVKRLTKEKKPDVSLYARFKSVIMEYGKVAAPKPQALRAHTACTHAACAVCRDAHRGRLYALV